MPRNILAIFVITLFITSCNISVNKSIEIADGKTSYKSLTTVNGGITIGKDCEINGSCKTVNGPIRVGENSIVQDMQTVNGPIDIGMNVNVDGKVESVNGSVTCGSGVNVSRDINTINGDIELLRTYVDGNLKTYNGNITIEDESIVEGNIIVKRASSSSEQGRSIKIQILDNSVIKGDVLVQDEDLNVEVYLLNGGSINGRVENAEVVQ